MYKKILTLTIAAALALSLASCGDSSSGSAGDPGFSSASSESGNASSAGSGDASSSAPAGSDSEESDIMEPAKVTVANESDGSGGADTSAPDTSVSDTQPENAPETPDTSGPDEVAGISNEEEGGEPAGSSTADHSWEMSEEDRAFLLETMLKGQYAENYDFCDVAVTPDAVVVDIANDGIAYSVANLMDEPGMTDKWEEIKDGICSLCNSTTDAASSMGLDVTSMIRILNDVDHEKVLLVVMDGVVLYDCTQG